MAERIEVIGAFCVEAGSGLWRARVRRKTDMSE